MVFVGRPRNHPHRSELLESRYIEVDEIARLHLRDPVPALISPDLSLDVRDEVFRAGDKQPAIALARQSIVRERLNERLPQLALGLSEVCFLSQFQLNCSAPCL